MTRGQLSLANVVITSGLKFSSKGKAAKLELFSRKSATFLVTISAIINVNGVQINDLFFDQIQLYFHENQAKKSWMAVLLYAYGTGSGWGCLYVPAVSFK